MQLYGHLQAGHHVTAAVALPGPQYGSGTTVGIDRRQDANAGAVEQLVAHEIHRPALVRRRGIAAVVAQLGADPALRHLVAHLKALLAVKAVNPLQVDLPSLAAQHRPDLAVAVTRVRCGDLADAFAEQGLLGPG